MLDSRLFWMYFQSNSAPLAPTHNRRNLVSNTSAPAHPTPAVKTFACPLPGILFNTNRIPTKSAKSIEDFKNSYKVYYILCEIINNIFVIINTSQ